MLEEEGVDSKTVMQNFVMQKKRADTAEEELQNLNETNQIVIEKAKKKNTELSLQLKK